MTCTDADEWVLDPDDKLDFTFDWQPDAADLQPGQIPPLATGETIDSYSLTVTGPDDTLVASDESSDDTTVSLWLTGGTVGVKNYSIYEVTCHIVTDQGREFDRTKKVRVKQR